MIPYGRQLIEEDDIAAVVEQLRSDWLTQGPTVARFEEALCELTGARYAVAVSSGTAALHLAALAAGVRSGDTGVTSDVTFVASANCIRYAGGSPRLVDVDPRTGHISLEALRKVVAELKGQGKPPKVIVPVDFSGSAADLEGVRAIADSVGAAVIEDAAHSLGATYTARDGATRRAASCTHTQFAILSFHPVKHITTGEGGAICTNDEGAYRTLLELRTHGITKDPAKLKQVDGPWYYEQQSLGFHYRLTDLQCALGLSQAKKLGRFVARRRAIAARYDRAFSEAGFSSALRPLGQPPATVSSYHLYVIGLVQRAGETLTQVAARRRALYDGLRERGVGPQVHYIPVHRQPDFVTAGLSQGEFPGADTYYAGCLSLPMFPGMTDGDVDRVVDAVGSVLQKTS
ncbi:MAG: UDP-4-amino-4,6-dideoxy-N-acetyl-beta-L-altrosamine transaminase [Myxococcaceae bacterium]|nr:UDP-4-amino-4,6-dideoxy-N-acetyl-beta-L-altrosamine transaminase [Myxococcaceae bacterium]